MQAPKVVGRWGPETRKGSSLGMPWVLDLKNQIIIMPYMLKKKIKYSPNALALASVVIIQAEAPSVI